jgi:hypothetical protein
MVVQGPKLVSSLYHLLLHLGPWCLPQEQLTQLA